MTQIKVLLLRGVNVGGANRLPMPEFREMLAGLGLGQVQTHIQSGNAVFLDPGVDGLADKIKANMIMLFGFAPAMFFVTKAELEAAMSANPYAALGAQDGAKVHFFFLAEPMLPADLSALRAHAVEGEALHLEGLVLYLKAPNGIGRSVLADKLDKVVKTRMTGRNQRSVESILALTKTITV